MKSNLLLSLSFCLLFSCNKRDFPRYKMIEAEVRPLAFGEILFYKDSNSQGDGIDIRNTTKCFIDMCCNSKNVYCLYNGTADFSVPSTILVFKWDGTYKITFQCGRSLRNIAVDKENNYLIALASREDGGTDIVKYKL